uniref:DM13 domain-containing protein n=1 Tax=Globodera pallida TaxID=36090 RepID=A0A183CHZ9_GLOPA
MVIAALVSLIGGTSADEYYGVRLGSFRNITSGMFGNVWLANSTVIQITDFRMDKIQKHEILFAFASSDGKFAAVKSLYSVVTDDKGEDSLMSISKKHLGNGGPEKLRLVAVTPTGKKTNDFKQFGVATGKTMRFLSAVPIDKAAPESFCCIRNADQPTRGIIGEHYSANTGEISVEDDKTLTIHNLTLEANRAPDAWIFAGRGEVRQSSGKKAFVVGRDTPTRHCSLRDDYRGNDDLRVQLASGQNIYGIDYLSLFCYQYDVDFGHIGVRLNSQQNPVPAYIPPLGGNDQQTAKVRTEIDEDDVLESNDIDRGC